MSHTTFFGKKRSRTNDFLQNKAYVVCIMRLAEHVRYCVLTRTCKHSTFVQIGDITFPVINSNNVSYTIHNP